MHMLLLQTTFLFNIDINLVKPFRQFLRILASLILTYFFFVVCLNIAQFLVEGGWVMVHSMDKACGLECLELEKKT
jgi:hypothetical protein